MARRAQPREKRSGAWLITGLLLVTAGIGGYFVFKAVQNKISPPEQCVATQTGAGTVTIDNSQAGNAATITAVAQARGLPTRAAIVAIATARQESKLRNLDYGDRDSLGLFQQRPSQGWGTAQQIADPVYASGAFYSALVNVSDWQSLPVTEAAQKVQRSGYPDAYAQWESMATVLASAFTGSPDASLTCSFDAASVPVETPGSDGLTPRATAVGTALEHAYGSGESAAPQYTHSADGLTLVIGAGSAQAQRGYALWAVAQAQALNVERVAYADQVWTQESGKWETAGGGTRAARTGERLRRQGWMTPAVRQHAIDISPRAIRGDPSDRLRRRRKPDITALMSNNPVNVEILPSLYQIARNSHPTWRRYAERNFNLPRSQAHEHPQYHGPTRPGHHRGRDRSRSRPRRRRAGRDRTHDRGADRRRPGRPRHRARRRLDHRRRGDAVR